MKLGPFGRLAEWVFVHRIAVVVTTILITIISLIATLQLKIDTDLLALLPQNEPSVQAIRELHRSEHGASFVTISVETEDTTRLDPFLDKLVEELSQQDTVEFAIHEVDPDLAFRLGLLQLTPTEIDTLTNRLKGALILGSSLNPFVTQQLMDLGPLTEKIGQAGKNGLFGDGEHTGRVLIRPRGSQTDRDFAKRVMDQVESTLAKQEPEKNGIHVTWIGGPYRHNVEDREGVSTDIQSTGLASAVLVLLVTYIAFRSVKATLLLYMPVIFSSIVNLGVVWLLFGHVNTYTSFGTAILLGLGIDYATHLLARYREERWKGIAAHDASPEDTDAQRAQDKQRLIREAIRNTWDRTGPPVVTSALTSIAGFAALAIGSFAGFSQLGIVLAVGLVVSLLSALVLTPALIPWLDPNPPRPFASKTAQHSQSTYRLAPLGLMVVAILTVLAASRLPYITWEYDLSALRRNGMAYDELTPAQQQIVRDSYTPMIAEFDTDAELRSEHRRITKMVEQGGAPHIARIVSIESVLPFDQSERLAATTRLAELIDHPNLRYLPTPLVKNLLRLKGFEARPVVTDDIPKPLLYLMGAAEGKHRMMLFPKGNMWDLRENQAIASEVEVLLPGKKVAGEYLALAAMYRTVSRDLPRVGLAALLMVALLTWIDLKKFRSFAIAFGTLMAGIIWCGFLIERLGVKLSMINVVGLPILIGIGVDVVIHLFHRLREEGPGGVRRALRTTGMAAVVSTLTTVVSFISLALAGNRGIRSLGILVSAGLTIVFFATALLLPLALAAVWRRHRMKAPLSEEE